MSGATWGAIAVASFGAVAALRARDGSIGQILGMAVSAWGLIGLLIIGAVSVFGG